MKKQTPLVLPIVSIDVANVQTVNAGFAAGHGRQNLHLHIHRKRISNMRHLVHERKEAAWNLIDAIFSQQPVSYKELKEYKSQTRWAAPGTPGYKKPEQPLTARRPARKTTA